MLTSLYEKTNSTLETSMSIPEKYLSWNESFWVGSTKWVRMLMSSRPFSVLLTLSISSMKMIGFIHFCSMRMSTTRPHVDPT